MKKIFLIAAFIFGLTLSAQNPTPFDNSIRVKNLATQSGTPDIAVFDSNKVLKKIAWASLPSGLPSQTGHSGKYLTTNGTTASWATISGGSSNDLNETTLLGNFTEQNIQFQGGAAIDFFNIHHGYLNGIGLTATRSWDMPDASGILPIMVNGVPADVNGNIEVPAPSYQQVVTSGGLPYPQYYISGPDGGSNFSQLQLPDMGFSGGGYRFEGFSNDNFDYTGLSSIYEHSINGLNLASTSGTSGHKESSLAIYNGLFTLFQQSAANITRVEIETPISASIVKIPAPTSSGTYYTGLSVNGIPFGSDGDVSITGGGTTPTLQQVTDEDNSVTLGNEGILFEFKNSDNPSGSLSIYNADNDGGGAAHLGISQGSNLGLLTANNLFFGDVSTSFGVQSIYRAGSIANGGISYNLPTGTSSPLATEAYVDSVASGGDALVSNPLSQFASTTSSQLAGVISNETGTGVVVFSDSPTLTGTPNAPTQSANDNTTKIATTAYADAKVQNSLSASTTVAPSAAAVNTALDTTMKIITDMAGGSVINVSNTETLIYSLPIPANTLANGSWANVAFQLERLAGGATLNLRIYASTSAGTLGSQFAFFSTTATNRLTLDFQRDFKIVSNTLDPNKWPVGTGSLTNSGVTVSGGSPTTVTYNPTVDMWLHVTAIHTTTPANIQTFGSTLKFKK